MPRLVDGGKAPSLQSIITSLLFEGYEFSNSKILLKDLSDNKLFFYKRKYYLKLCKFYTFENKLTYKLLNLSNNKIIYRQINDDIYVYQINKCFKM